VGVARTKFLAKVASGVAKPDGLIAVPPDRELAFLHPLPVECVWGVGPATAKRLHAWNVRTVGELAALSESTLVAMLGRAVGRQLSALAHNRDFRRVEPGKRRGSIGSQRALGRCELSAEQLDGVLVALVDRVTRRMRRAGLAGRTVVLRLRFDDFKRASRSRTLSRATAATASVLFTARALLAAAGPLVERRGITLVGITICGLEHGSLQLTLPLDGRDGDALDATLDDVRDRFGTAAITRAVLLDADPALSAWLMPGEDEP
jgi:DNA polymerase-4